MDSPDIRALSDSTLLKEKINTIISEGTATGLDKFITNVQTTFQKLDLVTALIEASKENKTDMMRVLINHNADVDLTLQYATCFDQDKAIEALVEYRKKEGKPISLDRPIGEAAARGNEKATALLLKLGADPTNSGGWAVKFSIANNHEKTTKLLLACYSQKELEELRTCPDGTDAIRAAIETEKGRRRTKSEKQLRNVDTMEI